MSFFRITNEIHYTLLKDPTYSGYLQSNVKTDFVLRQPGLWCDLYSGVLNHKVREVILLIK